MLAAGIKLESLDELEGHLREEIGAQIKSGIHAQTAFSNAVEKVGRAESLREQFQRAHATNASNQRKFTGYFYSMLLVFYVLTATYAMARSGLSMSEWCLGMAAQITLLLLSLLCWRQIPARFPAIGSRVLQSAMGLIGGISGAAWFLAFACFVLPRCHFTTGELIVALLWAMVPTLVLPEAAFLLLHERESEELQTD